MGEQDGAAAPDPAEDDPAGRWELTLHRAHALLAALRETVTVLDADGRILYTNRSLDGILGYEVEQFDRLPIELVHPDETDEFLRLFERVRSMPGASVAGEFRLRAADGTWKVIEGSAVNMLHDPGMEAVVLVTRNLSQFDRPVDEARDRSRRVRELAARDAVTGLATRTGFIAALRRSLERRRTTGWQVAVGVVTLTTLDVVAATLGGAAADALLQAAATRVTGVVPPDDPVARISPDTFAILVESEDAAADAAAFVDGVAAALREPGLAAAEQGMEVIVSIVVADADDVDPHLVLHRAEQRRRRIVTPSAES
jgi:PAS domain S-box-containing protein/diguanylate cyclase (GGDEF)-like protein